MFRHLARATCVLVSLVSGAGLAWAGDVTGRIGLPEQAPKPPELVYKGYLDRQENASLAPRPFDPTPYIVVVLEILKLTRVRAWAERRREAKAEQSKAISA